MSVYYPYKTGKHLKDRQSGKILLLFCWDHEEIAQSVFMIDWAHFYAGQSAILVV